MRVCAHARVCVLLSESVRECVMEGLQASWPSLSWGKNKHKHRQNVRRAQCLEFLVGGIILCAK